MKVSEVSSRALPPIPNDPAKTNWVEKSGGLPSFIERIARHLQAKGRTPSTAIAIAISQSKKVCATGLTFGGRTPVSAPARARYCKAVAEWEALKAKNKAKTTAKTLKESDAAALADSAIGELLELSMLGESELSGEQAVAMAELEAIIEVFGPALDNRPLNERTVHVSGYTRRDGVHVAPYSRALRAIQDLLNPKSDVSEVVLPGQGTRIVNKPDKFGYAHVGIVNPFGETVAVGRLGQTTVEAQRKDVPDLYRRAESADLELRPEREPKIFQRMTKLSNLELLAQRQELMRRGWQGKTNWKRNRREINRRKLRVELNTGITDPTDEQIKRAEADHDAQVARQAERERLKGKSVNVPTLGGSDRVEQVVGMSLEQKELVEQGKLVWDPNATGGPWKKGNLVPAKKMKEAIVVGPGRRHGGGDRNFDESKIKRGRAGTPQGGRFIEKGASGSGAAAVARKVGVKNYGGEYDRRVENAVKQFQQRRGLQVDGVVGRQTAAAMLGQGRQETGSLTPEQFRDLKAQGKG